MNADSNHKLPSNQQDSFCTQMAYESFTPLWTLVWKASKAFHCGHKQAIVKWLIPWMAERGVMYCSAQYTCTVRYIPWINNAIPW